MRARRTFTLDPETLALLERVGNYSEYCNRTVLQHARLWTEALAILRDRGWSGVELVAACEALSGYSRGVASSAGAYLADELERIEQTRKQFAQHDIPPQRQRRCFTQIRRDAHLASALVILVREYWLENEDCRNAIRSTTSGDD